MAGDKKHNIIDILNFHKDFVFSCVCFASHLLFIPVFYLSSQMGLCIYNTSVCVLYALLFFLYEELPKIASLTFGIIESLFYCVLVTLITGLDCGMQFLCYALLCAEFFMVRDKNYSKVYYIIMGLLCVLVGLFITFYTGLDTVISDTLYFMKDKKLTDSFFDDHFVQLQYCYNIGLAALCLIATGLFCKIDIQKSRQESGSKSRYLDFISNHDPLTKLLNRRKSTELANKLELQSQESPGDSSGSCEWSVCIFDIDDFKKVNDTYGHSAGDEVLVAISDIITKYIDSLLQGIQFSRWGGEEFLIIFPFCGAQPLEILQKAAQKVAQKTFSFKSSFSGGSDTFNIHLTFGLSFSFQRHKNADDLINIADEYLRCGKQHGKNCIITEDEYLSFKEKTKEKTKDVPLAQKTEQKTNQKTKRKTDKKRGTQDE